MTPRAPHAWFCIRRLRAVVLALGLLTVTLPAHAHKPSDSYLTLDLSNPHLALQLDVALRDLEAAVGMDADADGHITWGEVKSRTNAASAYVLSRLQLSVDDTVCTPRIASRRMADYSDGPYLSLGMDSTCPLGAASTVSIDYGMLFHIDPTHRGLLRVLENGGETLHVLSPDDSHRDISAHGSVWRTLRDYVGLGVWHIWIGYDHIAFLCTLLLPAVLMRRGAGWVAQTALRPVMIDTAQIVTAFTVAHSITLTLATLQWVSMPSRWVEIAIALSVTVVALNNMYPVFARKRWLLAFAFGLIHGLGFATVLGELGVGAGTFMVALVSFNLGVEIGQLAIVGVLLPILFRLRLRRAYNPVVLYGGSASLSVLGGVWVMGRVLG